MTSIPAITVTNVSNTVVTEGGGATYTYTVVLDTAPTSDVTITLNSGTQLSTNVTSLTFTTANWNVAQTVTVTVIDDTVGEGNHTGVITSTVTSTDTSYNGLTVAPVQVTITDNDLPTSPREYTAQTGTANPFNGIDIGDNSTPTLAALDGATPLNAQAEAVWDQALANARDHLTNLLSDPNRDAIFADVFGRAGTDPATFEANKQTLLATLGGDGLQIDIDLRSDRELGGAFAAYAAIGHTGLERIYVNADKLNNGVLNVNLATSVLLEELAHALDWRLNGGVDSPGDEGQLFAAEVTGVVLTAEQRAVIDAENDSATLMIEGVQVLVELAASTATTGTDNPVLSAGTDTVTVTDTNQIQAADTFSGGTGTDTIAIGVVGAGVSVDLRAAATNGTAGFLSFEAIQFLNTSGTSTATFAAEQFGSGKIELTSSFTGTASSQGVVINLAAAGSFDASGFTFSTWTSGTDTFSLNGSTGTETIGGSSQADSISGAAGNDTLSGGDGNDTIDGGTGNDRMSGGAGVDFFITSAAGGSSTAATSNSLAATISGSSVDNLIFDNGVDIITDFVVGTDILSGRNTQTLINLVGQSRTLDLTANRGYYAYGEWDGRRFLFRSNWASSRYNDLIFVVGDSGTLTPITSTGYTILTDISGSIDTIAPTITSFSTTTANGSYKAGDSINITANTDENILAGGQITVTLNTSATVILTAATTGKTLTGTYTITAGQTSADLTVSSFSIGTGAIGTSNATPRDAGFGNALTSITVPSGVNNIAGSYSIVVDTTAPAALTLTAPADSGSNSSDGITKNSGFSISTPEANATWQYSTNGGSNWTAGSATSFAVADGTYNSGVIQVKQIDQAGNPGPITSSTASITIDTIAPTIAISDNNSGTAKIGQDVTFTFTFSEAVTGFSDAAITVGNGSKGTFTAVSSTTYTLVVTPTASSAGNITVDVSTTGVTDAADNQATAPAQYTQAFDTVAPSIASSGTPTANENIGADQTVYTVVATDTNSITYSLKANTGDVADFSINGDTGAVTLTGNPNFETKPSYSFTIVATDAAGNFSEQAVSLTINNVNEAPVITSATTASFAENGTGTVYTVTATDVDASTTLTYSLSGDDAALFNITDGAVTFKNAPNFESPTDSGLNNVYDINVIASDGALNTTQAVAITVTNVNEAPTAVTLTNQQTAIAENTSTATRIKVADIAITDDALGTNNLSVSGTDASFFEISGNALYLKANTALNFEAKTSYSVTVNVDDSTVGSTPDATTNFTLNVTNVNEAPTAVSLNNQVTAIAENTSTATRIKVADIAITDDALGTNNLSVSGTDASFFEISGNILYLKANTALNFEAKTSYSVTVNVDDSTVGNTPDATTNFTLTVTDVNEAPTAVSLNNQVTAIAENTSTTTRIKVADIAITDDTLGTNNLSVSGTDASFFEISGNVLYLKANTALNFEAKTSYSVNVNVDDTTVGNTPDATTNFTLNVTNVNEAPTVANAIANQTIAVNASFNYTFEANTFSDVDSDPLTYTVTLANGTALPSWLAFNGTTRTFSGTPTTPGNLDIKIVANDSKGGSIADEFQLSIVTPIVGTAANDSVFAISPAEIIDGAGGIDEVNYARSNSGVTIDLETGKGIGGYAQGDILTNIEKLTGSFYNDHLKGNAAYNYFYGGNGNDLLEAGSGGGFFYGENGNDTIYGGEGQDRLYGQTGNDLLDGKAGNDILLGGNDQDSLFGGAGNDILYGDDGNDELTGTNSTAKGIGEIDILYGGAGSDIFILGNATNIFYDDGNPLNMGKTDYARIKDYNQAQDIIKLTNGKNYYLGVSPGGIVSGTSIFIDNDGIGGLTSKDELIANLEGTSLTLGLITGSTQGFSFV